MNSGTIIIGSGYCGASAAFAMRQNGYTGPITLLGSEAEYPYERPPISKWDLGGLALPRLIHPPERYRENDIELIKNQTVVSIDRDANKVILESDEALPYDQLLIATGASARKFDSEQFPGIDINYLRNYADAQALHNKIELNNRILIIGAGFIGLELAGSLSAISNSVTVIEAQNRILARALPPAISERVSKIHADQKVDILSGTNIRSLTKKDDKKIVTCSNGDTFEVDIIIAGIGSVPKTELAANAGLHVDNGIKVDQNFRTNDPNIFAAGDCVSRLASDGHFHRFESWQIAGQHGEMVGAIMAGKNQSTDIVPWFWSDQFDHTLQVTGIDDGSYQYYERKLSDTALIVFQVNNANHLTYAAGIGKGLEISKNIRLMQKIIERGIEVDIDALKDANQGLKQQLRP